MSPDYWPQAVAHLCASDDVLARIIAAYPRERLVCREDPFGTLARSIVGQQISVKAASSVWRKLEDALGGMSQENVDGAAEDVMLDCGLSRQKRRYLKDLAGHFVSGKQRARTIRGSGGPHSALARTSIRRRSTPMGHT